MMLAKLVVNEGRASRADVPIRRFPFDIGRDEQCGLAIRHRLVSRSHCEIFVREGLLFVRDKQSTNGTYVDGQRVDEAPLPPGAQLVVGPLTFTAEYDQSHLRKRLNGAASTPAGPAAAIVSEAVGANGASGAVEAHPAADAELGDTPGDLDFSLDQELISSPEPPPVADGPALADAAEPVESAEPMLVDETDALPVPGEDDSLEFDLDSFAAVEEPPAVVEDEQASSSPSPAIEVEPPSADVSNDAMASGDDELDFILEELDSPGAVSESDTSARATDTLADDAASPAAETPIPQRDSEASAHPMEESVADAHLDLEDVDAVDRQVADSLAQSNLEFDLASHTDRSEESLSLGDDSDSLEMFALPELDEAAAADEPAAPPTADGEPSDAMLLEETPGEALEGPLTQNTAGLSEDEAALEFLLEDEPADAGLSAPADEAAEASSSPLQDELAPHTDDESLQLADVDEDSFELALSDLPAGDASGSTSEDPPPEVDSPESVELADDDSLELEFLESAEPAASADNSLGGIDIEDERVPTPHDAAIELDSSAELPRESAPEPDQFEPDDLALPTEPPQPEAIGGDAPESSLPETGHDATAAWLRDVAASQSEDSGAEVEMFAEEASSEFDLLAPIDDTGEGFPAASLDDTLPVDDLQESPDSAASASLEFDLDLTEGASPADSPAPTAESDPADLTDAPEFELSDELPSLESMLPDDSLSAGEAPLAELDEEIDLDPSPVSGTRSEDEESVMSELDDVGAGAEQLDEGMEDFLAFDEGESGDSLLSMEGAAEGLDLADDEASEVPLFDESASTAELAPPPDQTTVAKGKKKRAKAPKTPREGRGWWPFGKKKAASPAAGEASRAEAAPAANVQPAAEVPAAPKPAKPSKKAQKSAAKGEKKGFLSWPFSRKKKADDAGAIPAAADEAMPAEWDDPAIESLTDDAELMFDDPLASSDDEAEGLMSLDDFSDAPAEEFAPADSDADSFEELVAFDELDSADDTLPQPAAGADAPDEMFSLDDEAELELEPSEGPTEEAVVEEDDKEPVDDDLENFLRDLN